MPRPKTIVQPADLPVRKTHSQASALIGVRRLSHPDLMVEIEAMAVIPAARPGREAPAR